jgi:perosamine synthetase
MVVTESERLAERCRSLRNLCFQANKRYVHEEMGWNFRITNLQAAVGLAQLERLDEFVRKKRKMGRYYTEKLNDLELIQLPLERTPYADNIYWVYGIVLSDKLELDASDMIQCLAARNIGSRAFFYPMHKQPVFIKKGLFKNESYPVAERISRKGFYIPSGLSLREEQMDLVVKTLKEELR